MLNEFIQKKLKAARYKVLKNKSCFGEIPGLKGVWANARNLEDCREELRSALEDWVPVTLEDGDSIPGLRIGIDQRRLVRPLTHAR